MKKRISVNNIKSIIREIIDEPVCMEPHIRFNTKNNYLYIESGLNEIGKYNFDLGRVCDYADRFVNYSWGITENLKHINIQVANELTNEISAEIKEQYKEYYRIYNN